MRKKPIIIGVTGGSGGGKTSVSRAILSNFPDQKITMIEHDSYYKDQSHLTFEERVKTNYDHPLAFDTNLMIEQLNELIEGRPVDIPVYDYTKHTRSDRTIRLFVDTDDDIRIIRRIKRDMEERDRSLDSIIEQYTEVVKPMYHQFIEPTKRYADIVIPEGVSNIVAIDLINTKVASILNEAK